MPVNVDSDTDNPTHYDNGSSSNDNKSVLYEPNQHLFDSTLQHFATTRQSFYPSFDVTRRASAGPHQSHVSGSRKVPHALGPVAIGVGLSELD